MGSEECYYFLNMFIMKLKRDGEGVVDIWCLLCMNPHITKQHHVQLYIQVKLDHYMYIYTYCQTRTSFDFQTTYPIKSPETSSDKRNNE